jgi:drug/metabolite transporter (DMT)-like permease
VARLDTQGTPQIAPSVRQLSGPTAAALAAFAALCWSGNHVIARAVSNHVPPWSLNFVRWLLVAAIMAIFAGRTIRRDWPLVKSHARILLFLGVIGGGLFGTLQFVGLKYTGALNMGVLNSVAPALIALASFLIFRDAVTVVQMLGIGISLTGVLAVISRLDPAILQSLSFNRGDLIIVLNMGLWAIYSSCLRLRPPIALTTFLFALSVPAALVTAPVAVLEYMNGMTLQADVPTIGSLLYAAIISSILSYISWGRSVETLGATRAGAFLHLVPLFAALLATSLLGERLGVHHLIGFALILGGVTMAARRTNAAPDASRQPATAALRPAER